MTTIPFVKSLLQSVQPPKRMNSFSVYFSDKAWPTFISYHLLQWGKNTLQNWWRWNQNQPFPFCALQQNVVLCFLSYNDPWRTNVQLVILDSLSTKRYLQHKLKPKLTMINQPLTDRGVANSTFLIGFRNRVILGLCLGCNFTFGAWTVLFLSLFYRNNENISLWGRDKYIAEKPEQKFILHLNSAGTTVFGHTQTQWGQLNSKCRQ